MTKQLIGFSGYLIQKRAFKNTGLIATFFTEQGELLSGILHGGQKKHLAIFQPYYGQVYLRDGLSLFDKLEVSEPANVLNGVLMFCGLYVNELLGKLGKGLNDASLVYQAYQVLLNSLSEDNIELSLRRFENILLEQLGFGLDTRFDVKGKPISKNLQYVLLADMGFRQALSNEQSSETCFCIKGEDLQALQNFPNVPPSILVLCKQLNRQRIHFLLEGRELISRQLFTKA